MFTEVSKNLNNNEKSLISVKLIQLRSSIIDNQGGGQNDFNIGKIVSLFHNLSNRGLRLKLLRAAEICGKLWQNYKQIQDKRLIRMRLNVHVS